MHWPRFALLNFVGAGIWAASFVVAGWYLGEFLGADALFWIIGSIGLLALFALLVRHFRRRRAVRIVP